MSNPIGEDPKLKSLLGEPLSDVDNVDSFNKWRGSFLELYTQYLDSAGSEKASEAYKKFTKASTGLKKVVKKLQGLISSGNLSTEKVSVSAKMTMSELQSSLRKLIEEMAELLPKTEADIQSFGFSKWNMGAGLVRDGFLEYAVTMHSRAILKELRAAALDDVADRQVLDEIVYFGKKFDIFCGVMADLGLMIVAEKATEVLHGELLQEARQAEETATKLLRDKLTMSQHSAAKIRDSLPQSSLALNRFMRSEGDLMKATADDFDGDNSTSSYETIEEEITVSSYETIEKEDDSSYESIEESVSTTSEYETIEKEIEVSEYETDTDSDSSDSEEDITSRKKKTAVAPKGQPEPKTPTKGPKKAKSPTTPGGGKSKGSIGSKSPKGGPSKCGGTLGAGENSKGSEGMEKPEVHKKEEDDQEEEKDEAEGSSESDSDIDDADIPPPKKYGKTKIVPKSEMKEDPNMYSPTKRMNTKRSHYYHGATDKDALFPFRNRNKKAASKPEPKPEPPKDKKLRRVVHTETVTVRKKVEKPHTKKVHVKKEKPPIKTRVRHERKIIKKTRRKKEKPAPVPSDIEIELQNLEPESPTREKPVTKSGNRAVVRSSSTPMPPSSPLKAATADSSKLKRPEEKSESKDIDSKSSGVEKDGGIDEEPTAATPTRKKTIKKKGSKTVVRSASAPKLPKSDKEPTVATPTRKKAIKKKGSKKVLVRAASPGASKSEDSASNEPATPKPLAVTKLDSSDKEPTVATPTRMKTIKKSPKRVVARAVSAPVLPKSQNIPITPKTEPEKEGDKEADTVTTDSTGGSGSPKSSKDDEYELSVEKREKCYMWYARMGQPNKAAMKKRVAKMRDCDITVEDIDKLPWIAGGAMLRVSRMNTLMINNRPEVKVRKVKKSASNGF